MAAYAIVSAIVLFCVVIYSILAVGAESDKWQ